MIALVDCNSFYCSCERLFRPELKNKPVIVLSNNDGCAVSLTKEAKQLGLPMGAPYFQIKNFCKKNHVSVFSSNYSLYGDISHRVMNTLKQFTTSLEYYSIDEAFLSLEGYSSLKEIGFEIKNTVYKNVGIPVSVGIGPTKVLAKTANLIAKRSQQQHGGSFVLFPDNKGLLQEVDVSNIWGIGRKSASKLRMLEINTAYELQNANEQLIQKHLTVIGRKIVKELKGEPCIELEVQTDDRKHILSSRCFGRPVRHSFEIKEAVARHVSRACEKLRQQNSVAKVIRVYLRTNSFRDTPQHRGSGYARLTTGSNSTNQLIKLAHSIVDQVFKSQFEYKKCGVVLSELEKFAPAQLSLLEPNLDKKNELLMGVIDKINSKHGGNTVMFSSCGTQPGWLPLCQQRSPRYTTHWPELLKV